MNITMKLENLNGQHRMAVYLAGRCVERGLTEAQAGELVARLLNAQYAEAKI
jgi:hypothetical protein